MHWHRRRHPQRPRPSMLLLMKFSRLWAHQPHQYHQMRSRRGHLRLAVCVTDPCRRHRTRAKKRVIPSACHRHRSRPFQTFHDHRRRSMFQWRKCRYRRHHCRHIRLRKMRIHWQRLKQMQKRSRRQPIHRLPPPRRLLMIFLRLHLRLREFLLTHDRKDHVYSGAIPKALRAFGSRYSVAHSVAVIVKTRSYQSTHITRIHTHTGTSCLCRARVSTCQACRK